MPFPNFDYCLICEALRQEMGGKLSILGFFGVAPNVEILVANVTQPMTVSFLAGFPPVPEVGREYGHVVTVAKPDGVVIFQTPLNRLQVSPRGRGMLGIGFMIQPPYVAGRHSIRIIVNNELKLDTSFQIRQATPAELVAVGLPVPLPSGRAN
jgi:hypothetical protein